MVQLKSASDDEFGVYVVCRTADALSRFVASTVSRRFTEVLESVFSTLSRQKIVVVQLNWIKDYQRCASRVIEATAGTHIIAQYCTGSLLWKKLPRSRLDRPHSRNP